MLFLLDRIVESRQERNGWREGGPGLAKDLKTGSNSGHREHSRASHRRINHQAIGAE